MTLPEIVKYNDSRVVHLHYKTQHDLCSTFVRVQEFYESPFDGIRGNYFTLDTFIDAYAEKNGQFSYFSDWGGFNVPGNALIEFRDKFHWDFREKETVLYDCIGRDHEENFIYYRNPNFYVIGTFGDSVDEAREYVIHELAHAYYYLEPSYRESQDSIYDNLPGDVKAKVGVVLIDMGYTEGVIRDETQAYFSTDCDETLAARFDLTEYEVELAVPFRENFKHLV